MGGKAVYHVPALAKNTKNPWTSWTLGWNWWLLMMLMLGGSGNAVAGPMKLMVIITTTTSTASTITMTMMVPIHEHRRSHRMSGGIGLVKQRGMVTSGGVIIGTALLVGHMILYLVVGYLSGVMDLCGNIGDVMMVLKGPRTLQI